MVQLPNLPKYLWNAEPFLANLYTTTMEVWYSTFPILVTVHGVGLLSLVLLTVLLLSD